MSDLPSSLPPRLPPLGIRDAGDAWVYGPDGQKFWGLFGAAGLLVWHETLGILLQHRVGWSHHGGTWGIPGGALKKGETAHAAALREANEEAGVPAELVAMIFTSVVDLDFWSYTTVVVQATESFEPVMGDGESQELRWVAVEAVELLPLHPGFQAAWPALRRQLVSHKNEAGH